MRITSGKVVDGRIVPAETVPDGTDVDIIFRDGQADFVADPELEAELLASIAQADRGELIPAEDVVKRFEKD